MNSTAACRTKDIHDEFVKAQVAGDKDGILELLVTGRCFPVKKGERVLVIESSWTLRKVRMKTGSEKGNA